MLGRKTAVKCDFCGEPIVNHLWIECTKCRKWFHVSCLSLSDVELKTIKTRSFNCRWCMGTCETLEAKSGGIIEELDNRNDLNSVKSSLENMKIGFSTYFFDVKRAIARVEASVFEKLTDLEKKSTILRDRKRLELINITRKL